MATTKTSLSARTPFCRNNRRRGNTLRISTHRRHNVPLSPWSIWLQRSFVKVTLHVETRILPTSVPDSMSRTWRRKKWSVRWKKPKYMVSIHFSHKSIRSLRLLLEIRGRSCSAKAWATQQPRRSSRQSTRSTFKRKKETAPLSQRCKQLTQRNMITYQPLYKDRVVKNSQWTSRGSWKRNSRRLLQKGDRRRCKSSMSARSSQRPIRRALWITTRA